jgi:hypothetical protein
MGEMRNKCKILVGQSEEMRALGRPRHRWKDIKIDFRDTSLGDVNWIHLPHNRDRWQAPVNTAINLRVP